MREGGYLLHVYTYRICFLLDILQNINGVLPSITAWDAFPQETFKLSVERGEMEQLIVG